MRIVVTGANGLVGSRLCRVLADRGVEVHAVVRRPGGAPAHPGVTERVGDFAEAAFAGAVLSGAQAAVTTVHPMASPPEVQHRVGVTGTAAFAQAAVAAGVERLVHISTAAVYDRSPGVGDVDEASPLVGDDAGAYPVTKRDTDLALAGVEGITRVLLRPPAILGAGASSVWNQLRPAAIRDNEAARSAVADATFAWVHADDLVRLAADLASAAVPATNDPATGPLQAGCTPVNVAAERATVADYHGAVTRALGVEPVWDDGPAWRGHLLAERARGWGWSPTIGLQEALEEIASGLRAG